MCYNNKKDCSKVGGLVMFEIGSRIMYGNTGV